MPDWRALISGTTLQKCSMITDIIEPLQTQYKCCGVEFRNIQNMNASTLASLKKPSCGQWLNNQPAVSCGCDDVTDSNCIDVSQARELYGCDGIPENTVSKIYTKGCLNDVLDILDGSSGLTLYFIGYGLGLLMLTCFLLSVKLLLIGRQEIHKSKKRPRKKTELIQTPSNPLSI